MTDERRGVRPETEEETRERFRRSMERHQVYTEARNELMTLHRLCDNIHLKVRDEDRRREMLGQLRDILRGLLTCFPDHLK